MLLALMAAVIPHAFPSPRPGNPKGLSARSFTLFVKLCTQHRNETTIIPYGLDQGWPHEINFEALPNRVKLLRAQLAAIVINPVGSPFYQDAEDELKKSGALCASSIQAQYCTFDRGYPG